MTEKTASEMYAELVAAGVIVQGNIEPNSFMEPTAYFAAPTTLAFSSPPLQDATLKAATNAKLRRSSKGNKQRKRRSRR